MRSAVASASLPVTADAAPHFTSTTSPHSRRHRGASLSDSDPPANTFKLAPFHSCRRSSHQKVTQMCAASNARIRSFFQFDPLEFVDEVVIATSEYINGGLASLTAILDLQDSPPSAKAELLRQLNKRLQKSLNLNSDLLEMFVMRNIFWVDIDVDLAFELSSAALPQSPALATDSDDSDRLDEELESLRASIAREAERRANLIRSIRGNEEKARAASLVAERAPAIESLLKDIEALPVGDVSRALTLLQSFRERLSPPPHGFVFD